MIASARAIRPDIAADRARTKAPFLAISLAVAGSPDDATSRRTKAVRIADKISELLGCNRWVVVRTEIWHIGSDGSK
jgi:hypothetical protein